MKYNVVGIVGEASDTPYIEVQYVKDDGHGQNVTERKMVVPPFVFGGHLVNIRYDSVVSYMGNNAISYRLELLRDHDANESEYLRIINHAEDRTIEYFIAGSQDVQVHKGECGLDFAGVVPNVCYQKAPVYYLLFPEKKHRGNLSVNDFDCREILYFEGDRCGDLKLTDAWEVNDVAKLYRAEFNKSKDTVLHFSLDKIFGSERLSEIAKKYRRPDLKVEHLYGTVPPKNRLEGNANIWLIATPRLFEPWLGYGAL